MYKNMIVCNGCKREEEQGIPPFEGSSEEVQHQVAEHLRNRTLWICVTIGSNPGSGSHHYCSTACLHKEIDNQVQQAKHAQDTSPLYGMLLGGPR